MVMVEVDFSRPLVLDADIVVEDDEIFSFWQQFEYEHAHLFCCRCGGVGHRSLSCTFSCHKSPPSPAITPSSHNKLGIEMIVVDSPIPQGSDDVGVLSLLYIHIKRCLCNPKSVMARLDGNLSSCPLTS